MPKLIKLTIKFLIKFIQLFFVTFRKLAFVLLLLFAISMTMFSGFATSVGTVLSTLGLTTAATDMAASLAQLKVDNKKLKADLKSSDAKIIKSQNKINNLETDLKRSRTQNKRLSQKADDLARSLKSASTVQKKITNLANRSVSRGARLLALNAGATAAEAGVGWFPYAGLAIGAGSLAWELKEICGQMDDMDEISVLLNAEKADRGYFSYLCSSDDSNKAKSTPSGRKQFTHDGKVYIQVYPDEVYSRPIFRLHDKYHALLNSGKTAAAKRLPGVKIDETYSIGEVIIFTVGDEVLIQSDKSYYKLVTN